MQRGVNVMIYQRCVWSTDEESCLLLFVRFGFRTLWVLSVCCRMKLEPGKACISLSPSEHQPISLPARGSRPRLQSSRRRVAVTRAAGSDRTLRTLLSKSCPRPSRSWRHRGYVRLSGARCLVQGSSSSVVVGVVGLKAVMSSGCVMRRRSSSS